MQIKHDAFLKAMIIIILLLNTLVLFVQTTGSEALHLGIIRAYICLFIVLYFISSRFLPMVINNYIIFFLVYLFVLAYLSDNPIYSLRMYMRVFITLLMLPVGYVFVNSMEKYRFINVYYIYILASIVLYIIFSNIFDYGVSTYLEDSFYTGATNVNIVKDMIILMAAIPIYYSLFLVSKKTVLLNNKMLVILSIATLIIVIIGMKRGALLALFAGLIYYFIFAPNKTRNTKYFLVVLVLLFITAPIYSPVLIQRYEHRQELIGRVTNIQETAEIRVDRLGEFLTTAELTLKSGVLTALFGQNLFDHVGVIPGFSSNRSLHVDYSVYLYGSGLIGLFLYIYMHVLIFFEKKKYYPFLKHDKKAREISMIITIVIITSMILSISGGWGNITLRTFIMLYIGASLGALRTLSKKKYLDYENSKQAL